MKYVFGPVPSRRLGMSLGIDLIPFKTCSYDCIYCELGRTIHKTTVRKEYISGSLILKQLQEYVSVLDSPPDYITISGSGEPTLNSQLGEIIKHIKTITKIPLAVLTNSSLLFMDEVKKDLLEADIVLPSLDAVSPNIFKYINRPDSRLTIDKIIRGLINFRKVFTGQIWLEILFCRAVNDDCKEVERMCETIEEIKPDKIQLNTVVRPAFEDYVTPLNGIQLQAIKKKLGTRAEIIATTIPSQGGTHFIDNEENILNLIARRPCTMEDICIALELHPNETFKYLCKLEKESRIGHTLYNRHMYYQAVNL
jgi:wyosine [tRNA(Phe)-imidazoG37] synthetase (radical SAM superfamily)